MKRSNGEIAILAGGSMLLLLILFINGIPVAGGLIGAFKNYNITLGLFGSPFSGTQNLSALFSNPDFLKALWNTIYMNLLYLLTVSVLSVMLAASLFTLNKRLQNFFITLLLVPLFIPSSVFTHLCLFWFGGTENLVQSQLAPLIYILVLTIKNVGVPTLFILKTWQISRGRTEASGFEKILAPLAFILIQFTSILGSDMDLIRGLIHPQVYEKGQTLDYYAYRAGFMAGNVNVVHGLWFLKLLVHLSIGIMIYYVVKSIPGRKNISFDYEQKENKLPDINNVTPAESDAKPAINYSTSHLSGIIFPAVYSLSLLAFLFKPLLLDGIKNLGNLFQLSETFMYSYVIYLILFAVTALVGVPITILLAKSMLVKGVFGSLSRGLTVFLLLGGGMGMNTYLFIRNLGLIDTISGLLIFYLVPLGNSLVLAVILTHQKPVNRDEKAERSFVWQAAIILGLMHFIFMWNTDYVPLILLSARNTLPPVLLSNSDLQLLYAQNRMGPELFMGADLLVVLPPVVLFLLFRRFITEWILLCFIRKS